jgi:hypothetical protein
MKQVRFTIFTVKIDCSSPWFGLAESGTSNFTVKTYGALSSMPCDDLDIDGYPEKYGHRRRGGFHGENL